VTKDAISPDLKAIKLNHLQCHEETAKKLHFMKLEPTMTFCFYIRSHEDYRKFENFMEEGKLKFKDDWIFSCMEQKPAYMKEQKLRAPVDRDEFESLEDMQFVPKNKFEAKTFMQTPNLAMAKSQPDP
jgi:hypothetical protein